LAWAGSAGVAGPGGAAGPPEVWLVAGGDVTLGARLEEHLKALAADDGTLDPHAYPFARIAHRLREADLALVNLEGPFTAGGKRLPKNFNFRGSPHLAAALARAGIGAVSLANNHTMDYGPEGLRDTLAALAGEGIAAFGAGRTLQEARRGVAVQRQGMRIGLLGYLFLGEPSLEPREVFAGPRRPGAAGHPASAAEVEAMVREDVPRLRATADVVVVSFHWGREKRYEPEASQRRLGRAAIAAGAAVVLGHHPHVLQGLEAYGGGLIAYSLGNFVFGGKWKPDDTDSILLKVRLVPAGVAGYEVVPITLGVYPHAPFQPVELAGEEAARVRRRLAALSAPLGASRHGPGAGGQGSGRD
jgi:poly-gamma-glutamate synthesis protein (capsule biosynthesis protein)